MTFTFDRARRTSRGATSSAACARRSASRSSTCTTCPRAATACSTALADARCAVRLHACTISISRARRSRSSPRTGCYCGGVTDARGVRALPRRAAARSPASTSGRGARGTARSSRGAAFLIAPSQWAADMLDALLPGAVDVARDPARPRADAKPAAPATAPRARSTLPDDGMPPTVAVLGAIGPDKGARGSSGWSRSRARAACRCVSC